MASYDYGGHRRGSGSFFGMVLALLLGAAALGFFINRARSGIAGRFAAMISGRPLNIVSAPMVIEKIQRLNRLELSSTRWTRSSKAMNRTRFFPTLSRATSS